MAIKLQSKQGPAAVEKMSKVLSKLRMLSSIVSSCTCTLSSSACINVHECVSVKAYIKPKPRCDKYILLSSVVVWDCVSERILETVFLVVFNHAFKTCCIPARLIFYIANKVGFQVLFLWQVPKMHKKIHPVLVLWFHFSDILILQLPAYISNTNYITEWLAIHIQARFRLLAFTVLTET
jgi:hypothetical protein